MSNIVFPGWARLTPGGALFSAGVGLALVDQISRNAPPFADALRQRLALRAAAASAAALRLRLRLREDEVPSRDAEHLASGAAQVDLPPDLDWPALAGALQGALADHAQPLAAAATAGAVLARELPTTRRAEAEILAWRAADVTLAERLE